MSFLSTLADILNSPPEEAIEKIYHSPSKQRVAQFAPPGCARKLDTAAQTPIEANKHYITVTSQKTVLPYDRVLFKTFYGVVHSTILVRDDDGEPRSLTTFAGLDPALTAIDKRAGEKIVQGPRTLLEFAPFRGTAIGSTIALLAVEAANYAKPLLSTLQKMSDLGGVAFFSAAKALAEPLISGVQALSEAAGSGAQVVYAGNLPLHTGIFLVAGVDARDFDWADYTFASDYTLLRRGTPVGDFPYMVLTIEASANRPNWKQIPELRDAQAALNAAVKEAGPAILNPSSPERAKVESALLALEWACLNTPDLCSEDADYIAGQARAKIEKFLHFADAGIGSGMRGIAGPSDAREFRDRLRRVDRVATPAFSFDDIEPFPRSDR